MDKKINILVVDDEQIIIDSIKKSLRNKENYSIYGELSVENALNSMESSDVDIVLTDLMMPDIDGLEFIEIVKVKYPKILMIMITGYATINTALQAMQIGAFDYIAKPFTREEIRNVVRRAADLVSVAENSAENSNSLLSNESIGIIKGIGQYTWMITQEDGTVLIGVERSFIISLGQIQTVYLPSEGDELRQGSTYFQVFSTDLRCQSLLSPLSGIVLKTNGKVIKDPNIALLDPYGEGWLLKIKPTNFEEDLKLMGL